MRTKNPARNRVVVKIYPEEWEHIKNQRKYGETFADVVKRLIRRPEQ